MHTNLLNCVTCGRGKRGKRSANSNSDDKNHVYELYSGGPYNQLLTKSIVIAKLKGCLTSSGCRMHHSIINEAWIGKTESNTDLHDCHEDLVWSIDKISPLPSANTVIHIIPKSRVISVNVVGVEGTTS